jgi:hypothetical protein
MVCRNRKLDNYYANKQKRLDHNRKYGDKLRDAAFAAYGGPHCSCCGEHRVEFLTIDHVNGGGAEHRREIGKSTRQLHLWLKRNNYPEGFRILCVNCNFSIGIRGYCPHEKERALEKYGVDEQQVENEKRASDGCPECGRKAERHGNVLACPVHGTEPFEAKKEP